MFKPLKELSMIDERIQQTVGILKEKQVNIWLIFVQETGSAIIITAKGDTLVNAGSDQGGALFGGRSKIT